MKKILIAEVAVLVVLVIAALVIGLAGPANTPDTQLSSGDPSASADVFHEQTDPPTDPPTQPPTDPPTEPPTDPPVATAPASWSLAARQYFVFDCQTEQFLVLAGDKDDVVYPASITKLFSAFVALQYLDPETVITAGDELDLIAPDSSIAYIQKGHRLTAAMLVEGMLLPSGNDAAYILATAAARQASGNQSMSATAAISYFVELMNSSAKSLGLTASHFSNPDGYHADDHYTSCHDLTIIARLALGNKTIRQYVATESDDVRYASGETNTWYNTNALINRDSPYYRSAAIGLKTGFTDEAGNCLLSAFQTGGKTYIIGVFGCPEKADRFKDTVKLYEELIEN